MRILRLPGVQTKTGLARDSIYRGGREGWFPKPVKINARATGWIESEVDEFIERRIRERDAGDPGAKPSAPSVPVGDTSPVAGGSRISAMAPERRGSGGAATAAP